jgi:hypothetical protein
MQTGTGTRPECRAADVPTISTVTDNQKESHRPPLPVHLASLVTELGQSQPKLYLDADVAVYRSVENIDNVELDGELDGGLLEADSLREFRKLRIGRSLFE